MTLPCLFVCEGGRGGRERVSWGKVLRADMTTFPAMLMFMHEPVTVYGYVTVL